MAARSEASMSGSPFEEFDRQDWARLAPNTPMPLTEGELHQVRSRGDMLDASEVTEVYQPLSQLLRLYVTSARNLHQSTRDFLNENGPTTPFLIGVAGSVAVGKSTTSRVLRELLGRYPDTPRVQLVTTDGFLWPTAELERRGILDRKGFPESYDRRALLRFVAQIKSGVTAVEAPSYSHLLYDREEGVTQLVESPDIVIVEGLNVLQPPSTHSALAVSDLFDFSIFVDARTTDIATWYEERFLSLQEGAFADPRSYFHRYSSLTEPEARKEARRIWKEINWPNLRDNILPTRPRASLILRKGSDHRVHSILLRKI
jgi:type I pantothenate kinase